MGVFDRAGKYVSKRFLSEGNSSAWNSIENSTANLRANRIDHKGLLALWRGPADEEAGRTLYKEEVIKYIGSEKDAKDIAFRLTIMSWMIGILGIVMIISLLLVSSVLFKICFLFAGLMFGGVAMINYHRAEQIKQQRIFGLRELF